MRNGVQNKERTAAWFTGIYQPINHVSHRCAYEGDVGSTVHQCAAPMIADIFKEVYKGQQANGCKKRPAREETECAAPSPSKKRRESD
jgi:hypothetical protein